MLSLSETEEEELSLIWSSSASESEATAPDSAAVQNKAICGRKKYTRKQLRTGKNSKCKSSERGRAGVIEELTIEHYASSHEDEGLGSKKKDELVEEYDEEQNIGIRNSTVRELDIEEDEERSSERCSYVSDPSKKKDNDRLETRNCYSERYQHHPSKARRQQTRAARSVNMERKLSLGRKIVLYGQTPPAMAKSQLRAMAEASGLSLKEFSQNVIGASTQKNLQTLRQYHTTLQPQLSSFFDELETCDVSDSPVEENIGSEKENVTLNTGNRNFGTGKYAHNIPIANEDIAGPSHSRVGYKLSGKETKSVAKSENQNKDLGFIDRKWGKAHGVKENRKRLSPIAANSQTKTFRVESGEGRSIQESANKKIRTVIPDTESDTDSDKESTRSSIKYNYHENGNQTVFKNVLIQSSSDNTNGSLSRRSITVQEDSSVSSLFPSLTDREHEVTTNSSKDALERLGSHEYNSVLDSLLFDEDDRTESSVNTLHKVDMNMKEENIIKEEILSKINSSITRNRKEHYNSILDTLLFSKSLSPVASTSLSDDNTVPATPDMIEEVDKTITSNTKLATPDLTDEVEMDNINRDALVASADVEDQDVIYTCSSNTKLSSPPVIELSDDSNSSTSNTPDITEIVNTKRTIGNTAQVTKNAETLDYVSEKLEAKDDYDCLTSKVSSDLPGDKASDSRHLPSSLELVESPWHTLGESPEF